MTDCHKLFMVKINKMMKYDARAIFLIFPFVSVKYIQNVLRFQQVITLRHSMGFQVNLVHEQTTLPPTSFSQ